MSPTERSEETKHRPGYRCTQTHSPPSDARQASLGLKRPLTGFIKNSDMKSWSVAMTHWLRNLQRLISHCRVIMHLIWGGGCFSTLKNVRTSVCVCRHSAVCIHITYKASLLHLTRYVGLCLSLLFIHTHGHTCTQQQQKYEYKIEEHKNIKYKRLDLCNTAKVIRFNFLPLKLHKLHP